MAERSVREQAMWDAVVIQRRVADALASACDDAVRSGYIGSRSEIADALLDYQDAVVDLRGAAAEVLAAGAPESNSVRVPSDPPGKIQAMTEFGTPLKYNDRGRRVKDANFVLAEANVLHRNFRPGPRDGIFGKQMIAACQEARFELGYELAACKQPVFGQPLFDLLTGRAKPTKRMLVLRHARAGKRLVTPGQSPALPGRIDFNGRAMWPEPNTPHGLQPWIVPQVEAIIKRFGLVVTAGYGGHPPHAPWSDHGWGGAADLAGSLDAMTRCTLWADGLCSGFYRRGAVFRWVGGPAHDANGVEPGHYNHVHLSWYRGGPATTVFGTSRFPG